MKKSLTKIVLSISFIVISFSTYSQTGGVSINKTNDPADPSAMLDVSSTLPPYMGILFPRMTTANRNAIVSPATGLHIFNTDCGITEYYTGTCWISISQALKTPDQISCSGTTDFCSGETRTFTISPVTGATSYVWTAPAGAIITSGQGTTSATVLFGNHSGEVWVRAVNLCEASPNSFINLYVNPVPPTPGNITGPTTVVPGTSATYFIAAVAGAGVYNWTVPPGATITSGVGTTTITVNFSCSVVSGNITVSAQSNCGASVANALAITMTPLLVSAGPDISSPGTLGGSPTASGGASPYTYAWLPSSSLSSTSVANPSTTVCTTTTYTVTVTDANGCSSNSSATATEDPIPSSPGSITGNTTITCNTTGNVYSITSVTYATTYMWTVPSGAAITSGQGTTSISVSFGNGTSGNISVSAENRCGTSSPSTIAVTVSGSGSGSQAFNATGSGRTGSIQTFTVPTCVASITVQAFGAQGGNGASRAGGKGAKMVGTFTVTPGQILKILVGQQGLPGPSYYTGGGGGTFVADNSNNPLIVAGGGGGGNDGGGFVGSDALTTTNGANSSRGIAGGTGGNGGSGGTGGGGGGGFLTDGSTGSTCNNNPGQAFVNGGLGAAATHPGNSGDGGFGGGGSGDGQCCGQGGAGGGYSGGGGGGTTCGQGIGGGGGSYNGGTSQTNTASFQTGNGQVIISW